RQRITLGADEERSETIDVPIARIRLSVRRRGRNVRNTTVRLRRSGTEEVVAEIRPSDAFLLIAAGRYDAHVSFTGGEVEVSGLMFPTDAQREMPIDIQ
ncbi:MAG: hypothetical protein OEY14_02050, partial [Myxococcales bacterium]|nr:hypothetical protein [Myxococcales bacterium]